jgi:alpha-glucosidase
LNYTLVALPWNADRFQAAVNALESALPDGAWPNLALGSHDETRVATRVGPEAAKAAMLLLLTLRGTPILYYGDEIGMTNTAIAPAHVRDTFGGSGSTLGRDGQRTPMQWDNNTPNAGFSPAAVRPWLPTPANLGGATVAEQTGEPASLLQLTRRLLSVRHVTPALRRGDYSAVDGPAGCFAFRRTLDHGSELDRVLVALNFTGEPLALPLTPGTNRRVLVSTDPDRDGCTVSDQLTLRAHEACVMHEL